MHARRPKKPGRHRGRQRGRILRNIGVLVIALGAAFLFPPEARPDRHVGP